MEVLKTCSKCNEQKHITNYHRNLKSKDGHRPDCKTCVNKRHNEIYKTHPEKFVLRAKEYASNNKEKYTEYQKEYRLRNNEKIKNTVHDRYYNRGGKERMRDYNLKRHYNISLEEYNALFAKQGNCCAICKREKCKTGKEMAVDHCHETGKVRGILCANCNRSLGVLGESMEVLTNMINYLYEHKE